MRKRVLVTGASGFIGRQALPALLLRGYEVHVATRQPLTVSGINWHSADLLQAQLLPALLKSIKPSHLLHFAWYAEHGKFWESLENRRWVDCSVALLEAFQQAGGRFVAAAGTCAEYDWRDAPCDEDSTPLLPKTEYGTCKHAAHLQMAAFCRQSGMSFAWGRIFHLYGPHEHPARFVASIIRALLHDKEAPCTQGTQLRDFLHVEDVAEAFVTLLDAEATGTFNIGSGRAITLADLGQRIAALIGKPNLLKLGVRPMAPGDPPVLVPLIHRLTLELKWSPRYTLDAGLQHAVEWWKCRELPRTQEIHYRENRH